MKSSMLGLLGAAAFGLAIALAPHARAGDDRLAAPGPSFDDTGLLAGDIVALGDADLGGQRGSGTGAELLGGLLIPSEDFDAASGVGALNNLISTLLTVLPPGNTVQAKINGTTLMQHSLTNPVALDVVGPPVSIHLSAGGP